MGEVLAPVELPTFGNYIKLPVSSPRERDQPIHCPYSWELGYCSDFPYEIQFPMLFGGIGARACSEISILETAARTSLPLQVTAAPLPPSDSSPDFHGETIEEIPLLARYPGSWPHPVRTKKRKSGMSYFVATEIGADSNIATTDFTERYQHKAHTQSDEERTSQNGEQAASVMSEYGQGLPTSNENIKVER